MMYTSTYISPFPEKQMRLDLFCSKAFPELSRTFLQKAIENQGVLVNGTVILKKSFLLKQGDMVTITQFHQEGLGGGATPQPLPLSIIDLTEDFIVIDKQAGISVHPSPSDPSSPTIVHALLYHFPEFSLFQSENNTQTIERPGIVHRLDKDTSGVLLIARTVQSSFALSNLFKDRLICKKYEAFVQGHPPQEGNIRFNITRHPVHRYKMTHSVLQGREAHTEYHVSNSYESASKLDVTLHTGRTHQIRVHCAAIGHCVIGDKVYGTQSPFISRQALHASFCSFTFKGKSYSFQAPLPEDMLILEEKLKKI